jgi:hypothetical protein
VSELDAYLAELERALRPLRRRERRRALREARDHLLCAAAEGEAEGLERTAAVRSAIASFGAADTIAASYLGHGSERSGLSGALVGAVVLAALTMLPIGGGLGQLFVSTSNAAERGCAGRWNTGPPSALYPLAWVSSPGAACDVVLHDASHAVVFRQDTRTSGWYVLRPSGKPSWTVATLPVRFRARDYTVVGDGQITRLVASHAG